MYRRTDKQIQIVTKEISWFRENHQWPVTDNNALLIMQLLKSIITWSFKTLLKDAIFRLYKLFLLICTHTNIVSASVSQVIQKAATLNSFRNIPCCKEQKKQTLFILPGSQQFFILAPPQWLQMLPCSKGFSELFDKVSQNLLPDHTTLFGV